MEAASISKILVPTYWNTYCHLPKKSITKKQTLESHIMHKTSVSNIPFSLSTLASSFASVITTIQSSDLSVLRCPNYHKPPHSTFDSSTIHIFNSCCTNNSIVMEQIQLNQYPKNLKQVTGNLYMKHPHWCNNHIIYQYLQSHTTHSFTIIYQLASTR